MVALRQFMRQPPVEWRTATPLWWEYGGRDDDRFHQPAVLRFASDTFMDDFVALAQRESTRMGEWCVRKETWRLPAPTPQLGGPSLPSLACGEDESSLPEELQRETLKLFQPAHERYYLVTASLVCRIPGLPDKTLNHAEGEQVSFVLRRKMRQDGTIPKGANNPVMEFALVNGRWEEIPAGQEQNLRRNEEEYGLFPTAYDDPRRDGRRRLFAGLIPVSRREQLLNAGRAPKATASSLPTLPEEQQKKEKEERIEHLMTLLDMDVIQPWKEIKGQSRRAANYIDTSLNPPADWPQVSSQLTMFLKLKNYTEAQRDQLQVNSWLVMLDLARFLKSYLPAVWKDLNKTSTTLQGAQRELWVRLRDTEYTLDGNDSQIDINTLKGALNDPNRARPYYLEDILHLIKLPKGTAKLADRLKELDVQSVRDKLETVLVDYTGSSSSNWPYASRFLLSDPDSMTLVPLDDEKLSSDPLPLSKLVCAALKEKVVDEIDERVPQAPLSAQISSSTGQNDYADNEFVVRCVYKRPCHPLPSRQVLVSEPTCPFQMASYYDPDAPTRPFRIPMPIDTSPAGLRKFAKNAMFVLSDTLACQVGAARNLTFGDLVLSVLPWPFHKDLPDARPDDCKSGSLDKGMLCTLSIPIVTVCALILLIIIVQLLDIIFKWVPYLIFCLPLPGLKAKDRSA